MSSPSKCALLAVVVTSAVVTPSWAQAPSTAPAAQRLQQPVPQAGAAPPAAQPAPPSPSPQAVPGKSPQWPVTLPDPAAKAAEAEPEPGWTQAEIATARARCNVILAAHKAVAQPMDPIREGDCGTPYPVQLTAIGKVELSQPAIVNCEMVAVLSDWMKSDVQPAARRHLGAQVTRIEVLSSYSCRNAYGRKKSRLSEHGRANAIDIKGFALERGAGVDLMAHWGLTERDIKARIAAAEAAAKAHAAAKAKADAELRAAHARSKSAPPPAVAGTETRPTANGLSVLRGMVPDGIARPGQGDGEEQGSASTLTLGQPSRLGGPKAKNEAPVAAAPAGSGPIAAPKSAPAVTPSAPRGPEAFLRQIHEAACKRFGTVLGPEANEAHRNHFHLDLAERNRGNYCE